MTHGLTAFAYDYALSPIYLVNGVAGPTANAAIGLTSLTSSNSKSNTPFATYAPLPGSTLLENDVATYPFANQAIAGNAMIAMPTTLSMLMICPANTNGSGFDNTQLIMTALVSTLKQHVALGGTFYIATPKFAYTNGLLRRMVDVSSAETKQAQNTYQLDFYFPLLTLADAQNAQNALMAKLSNGSTIQGQPSYSGTQTATGQNTQIPQS